MIWKAITRTSTIPSVQLTQSERLKINTEFNKLTRPQELHVALGADKWPVKGLIKNMIYVPLPPVLVGARLE